jgi:hypothetical protein
MKTRTVCLPPGELLPGMVVATQVSGAQGSVLLAAGSVLDAPALDKLRRRGIEALTVSIPDTRDEATIAGELAAAAARVDHIFRGPGSAARTALRDAVHAYRRKQAE